MFFHFWWYAEQTQLKMYWFLKTEGFSNHFKHYAQNTLNGTIKLKS